jgi:hypothetical protein
MEYIKIDENTYQVKQEPIVVDIAKLKKERDALLVEKEIEISDMELLEWAKQNHPYYITNLMNKELVVKLDEKIKEIESYG